MTRINIVVKLLNHNFLICAIKGVKPMFVWDRLAVASLVFISFVGVCRVPLMGKSLKKQANKRTNKTNNYLQLRPEVRAVNDFNIWAERFSFPNIPSTILAQESLLKKEIRFRPGILSLRGQDQFSFWKGQHLKGAPRLIRPGLQIISQIFWKVIGIFF